MAYFSPSCGPTRGIWPVALATLAALAAVEAGEAQPQFPPFVEMRVPKAPAVASGDGVSFLVHELHVTNFHPSPLSIVKIEVLSADADDRVLVALADSALIRSLSRPGITPAPPFEERARLGGGLRAVVFLWVPLEGGRSPSSVRHRLTVLRGTGDSARTGVVTGGVASVTRDMAVIGPPLRGGGWLVANGPDPNTGHRRALVPVDGAPAIAQRFAIDYVKMNEHGRRFIGDSLKNESYFAEGVDALAVADGIVVSVKDSIPENVPGVTSRAVPITLETVGGNFVILDIGQGRYAFYAHLKPGSLRVRPGDRVRQGQVVGLVGNSGNSTEPHLHFHLADGTSPLGSEGIPYVHETFQLLGRCARMFSGCERKSPESRRREMPMGNMVVAFPD